MKLFSSPRFLGISNIALTATLALVLFSGFDAQRRDPHFKEVTVERINIVEPDGTLRMVISNKARTPGIYMKGREYLPGFRDTAGLIFLNDEGSETGGLSFSGSQGADGVARALGHISFDGYMQDQLIAMTATQEGETRRATVVINDQPFWDITEFLELLESIADLPPEEQQARLEDFLASRPSGQNRMILGRGSDRTLALAMKDEQGRPRIVMSIAPDGTPTLQFLNASGEVISRLP